MILGVAIALISGCWSAPSSTPHDGVASPLPTVAATGSMPPSPTGPLTSATPAGSDHAVAATLKVRLPYAVSRAVAFADDPLILLVGGLTSGGTHAGIITISVADGRAIAVGRLAVPVHDAAGAIVGGLPMVFGGGNVTPVDAVQGISSGQGTQLGRLPAARADLAAVAVDGSAIVVGGGTPARLDRQVLTTTDGVHFQALGMLLDGVRYPAVALVAGSIVVVGGTDGTHDLAVIQEVDPATGMVRIIGHLPHGLSHAAAFVIAGRLLVAGGRSGGRAQDAIWEIDPVTGGATIVGHLPVALSDACPVVLGDVGYLLGGEAASFEATIIAIRFE